MKETKIALIGRPNVGKSALFNRIIQKRMAIVDEMEGVTRDRMYAKVEAFGHCFELIDTGGIDTTARLPFAEEVKYQAEVAIEEASSLIMVVDGRAGITTLDEKIAHLLLRSKKPIILAINKIDNEHHTTSIFPFYALGITNMLPISAIHGIHIAELLENVLVSCPKTRKEKKHEGIKVAIIGKPNIGKSTMINTLLNQKRCIVSPIAGTTRDAIDVKLSYQEESFIFIDTAGIRKKRSEQVDHFAYIRCEEAIDRADLSLLMIDAREGITIQEKRMTRIIEKKGKGCLIFCNKWDLIKNFRMEHCKQGLESDASFLNHCPKLFGSALNGHNVTHVFSYIKEIDRHLKQRISTSQLNQFVEKTIQKVHPPLSKRGKRLRIYYMAQIDNYPPRFVLFVNNPHLLTENYKKYLIRQFRTTYHFTGVPLFFYLKGKRTLENTTYSSSPKMDVVFDEE